MQLVLVQSAFEVAEEDLDSPPLPINFANMFVMQHRRIEHAGYQIDRSLRFVQNLSLIHI